MAALTFSQIRELWIKNGGNPLSADIMAAIALAESGGRTDAHNPKPPDDSWGLWQINYIGNLGPSRTQRYGSPGYLVANPDAQAKAAIDISGNGSNLRPWTTYTSGSYKRFLGSSSLGGLPQIPATPALPSLVSSGGSTETGAADEGFLLCIKIPGIEGAKKIAQTINEAPTHLPKVPDIPGVTKSPGFLPDWWPFKIG